jgi:anthranilate synthase component 2
MLLVIDNYDSFTYNLVQYFGELGEDPRVVRNDALSVDGVAALEPKAIVLSPGPGVPADAGITIPVIKALGAKIPMLGVCLGHQAIGEAYGGKVIRAPRGVMHGKTSKVRHDATRLFDGVENPFEVMRYHSLVIEHGSCPPDLEVTATAIDDQTEIHAVQHRTHPVWGVQFHPESIGTPEGKRLLKNFLKLAGAFAFAFTLGCGAGDDDYSAGDQPWTTVVDSTGDTILVTITGEVPASLVRTLVPELTVGSVDGEEETSFGQIGAVLPTSTRGLLVHDAQASAIRMFDSTGAFVKNVGNKGGGPGEFDHLNGLTRLPDGRLVIWDATGARLNLYDPDGAFLTTWRLPFQGFFAQNLLSSDHSGRINAWAMLTRDSVDFSRGKAGIIRLDTSGKVLDSVFFPVWREPAPRLIARTPDGSGMSAFSFPFWPGSHSVASPVEGMVSGPGDPYRLYITHRAGRKPVRIDREHTPVPVSDTEREERKAQAIWGLRQTDPKWTWNVADIPASKPAYRGLTLGDDGTIWISISVPSEPIPAAEMPEIPANQPERPRITTRDPTVYDVFTPEGRLMGRVAMPPRTRITRMSAAGAWGVRRDSLDVEYAARFRIEPPFRP